MYFSGCDFALHALVFELGMFVPELGREIHAARLFFSISCGRTVRAWELLAAIGELHPYK